MAPRRGSTTRVSRRNPSPPTIRTRSRSRGKSTTRAPVDQSEEEEEEKEEEKPRRSTRTKKALTKKEQQQDQQEEPQDVIVPPSKRSSKRAPKSSPLSDSNNSNNEELPSPLASLSPRHRRASHRYLLSPGCMTSCHFFTKITITSVSLLFALVLFQIAVVLNYYDINHTIKSPLNFLFKTVMDVGIEEGIQPSPDSTPLYSQSTILTTILLLNLALAALYFPAHLFLETPSSPLSFFNLKPIKLPRERRQKRDKSQLSPVSTPSIEVKEVDNDEERDEIVEKGQKIIRKATTKKEKETKKSTTTRKTKKQIQEQEEEEQQKQQQNDEHVEENDDKIIVDENNDQEDIIINDDSNDMIPIEQEEEEEEKKQDDSFSLFFSFLSSLFNPFSSHSSSPQPINPDIINSLDSPDELTSTGVVLDGDDFGSSSNEKMSQVKNQPIPSPHSPASKSSKSQPQDKSSPQQQQQKQQHDDKQSSPQLSQQSDASNSSKYQLNSPLISKKITLPHINDELDDLYLLFPEFPHPDRPEIVSNRSNDGDHNHTDNNTTAGKKNYHNFERHDLSSSDSADSIGSYDSENIIASDEDEEIDSDMYGISFDQAKEEESNYYYSKMSMMKKTFATLEIPNNDPDLLLTPTQAPKQPDPSRNTRRSHSTVRKQHKDLLEQQQQRLQQTETSTYQSSPSSPLNKPHKTYNIPIEQTIVGSPLRNVTNNALNQYIEQIPHFNHVIDEASIVITDPGTSDHSSSTPRKGRKGDNNNNDDEEDEINAIPHTSTIIKQHRSQARNNSRTRRDKDIEYSIDHIAQRYAEDDSDTDSYTTQYRPHKSPFIHKRQPRDSDSDWESDHDDLLLRFDNFPSSHSKRSPSTSKSTLAHHLDQHNQFLREKQHKREQFYARKNERKTKKNSQQQQNNPSFAQDPFLYIFNTFIALIAFPVRFPVMIVNSIYNNLFNSDDGNNNNNNNNNTTTPKPSHLSSPNTQLSLPRVPTTPTSTNAYLTRLIEQYTPTTPQDGSLKTFFYCLLSTIFFLTFSISCGIFLHYTSLQSFLHDLKVLKPVYLFAHILFSKGMILPFHPQSTTTSPLMLFDSTLLVIFLAHLAVVVTLTEVITYFMNRAVASMTLASIGHKTQQQQQQQEQEQSQQPPKMMKLMLTRPNPFTLLLSAFPSLLQYTPYFRMMTYGLFVVILSFLFLVTPHFASPLHIPGLSNIELPLSIISHLSLTIILNIHSIIVSTGWVMYMMTLAMLVMVIFIIPVIQMIKRSLLDLLTTKSSSPQDQTNKPPQPPIFPVNCAQLAVLGHHWCQIGTIFGSLLIFTILLALISTLLFIPTSTLHTYNNLISSTIPAAPHYGSVVNGGVGQVEAVRQVITQRETSLMNTIILFSSQFRLSFALFLIINTIVFIYNTFTKTITKTTLLQSHDLFALTLLSKTITKKDELKDNDGKDGKDGKDVKRVHITPNNTPSTPIPLTIPFFLITLCRWFMMAISSTFITPSIITSVLPILLTLAHTITISPLHNIPVSALITTPSGPNSVQFAPNRDVAGEIVGVMARLWNKNSELLTTTPPSSIFTTLTATPLSSHSFTVIALAIFSLLFNILIIILSTPSQYQNLSQSEDPKQVKKLLKRELFFLFFAPQFSILLVSSVFLYCCTQSLYLTLGYGCVGMVSLVSHHLHHNHSRTVVIEGL